PACRHGSVSGHAADGCRAARQGAAQPRRDRQPAGTQRRELSRTPRPAREHPAPAHGGFAAVVPVVTGTGPAGLAPSPSALPQPAFEQFAVVVADRDDAVAGPVLAGAGGRLVPLFLQAELDAAAGVRQWHAHLVDAFAAWSMAADQHQAAGGEVAQVAERLLGDRVDRHDAGVDRLARRAALLAGAHGRAPGADVTVVRRLPVSGCQVRSSRPSRCGGSSRTWPAAIARASSRRFSSSPRWPRRVTNRLLPVIGENQASLRRVTSPEAGSVNSNQQP